ncbi:HNH endonuclease signature motif containing protein [Psychrobacter sp. 2Y5]|uniref:HNH endonuclease signature motif containing protein n=1 Tax=unclassified Psychrobacter TaxID=196806 RepID=UPI003F47569A
MIRRHYTAEELIWIRANQADMTRQQLTDAFNANFERSVSCNAISLLCIRKKYKSNAEAWNKGMAPTGRPFKKGHKVRSKPIGYECQRSNGDIYIKVAQPNVYKRKKFIVWEEHHGPIPANHEIRFLDNDKTNCTIDNLICVPSDISINVNVHNPADTDQPELNKAIYLTEVLKREIREVLKREKELHYG